MVMVCPSRSIVEGRSRRSGFPLRIGSFLLLVLPFSAQQDDGDPRAALERLREHRAAGASVEALAEVRALKEASAEAPAWFQAQLTRLEAEVTRVELAEAVRHGIAAVDAEAAGDRDLALQESRASHALFVEHLGAEHPETLRQQLHVAWRLGLAQDARAFVVETEAVAAAALETFPDPHPLKAASQAALGFAYLKSGRLEPANDAFKASRALWAQLEPFPVYGEDRATPVSGLAMIANSIGNAAEADALFREALTLIRADPGENSVSFGNLLNTIGSAYVIRGELREAERFLKRSLATKLELLPANHPGVANSLHNLAVLHLQTGEYAAAEELVLEALKDRVSNRSSDLQLATLLSNLAQSNLLRGRLEEAETFAREAVAIGRASFADRPVDFGAWMDTLAQVLVSRKKIEEAEKLLGEFDELSESDSGLRSSVLMLRARLELLRGEYGETYDLAEQARGLLLQTALPSNPNVANLRAMQARAMVREGELEEAEWLFMEAAEVQDAARLRARPGRGRSAFAGTETWRDLAWVRAALGDDAGAWEAQEHWRGRVVLELLADAERDALSKGDAKNYDDLTARLAYAEERFASGEQDAREDALRLETEIDELLDGARGAVGAALEPYEVERVQAVLAEDEALVGWIPGEDDLGESGLWIWRLRSEGESLWRFRKTTDLQGVVKAFRNQLADAAAAAFPPEVGPVETGGRELFGTLLGPIASDLDGINGLIIVPAAPVLGVPIEALVDEQGRVLDERWAVTYTPSGSVLAWLREGERAAAKGGAPVLAVGDPPFREEHRERVATDGKGENEEMTRTAGKDWAEGPSALPRLAASGREAAAVGAMFEGSTVLVGLDATERALDALDLTRYRAVHFATHALVDDERPERSALVLSQLDLPDALDDTLAGSRVDDGLLQASEVAREWRLNAELVVLSACETALGRPVAGEGYLGLADAFLQAGARSVIASLWNVDDQATELFMTTFYAAWKTGAPKSAALQTARQALRNTPEFAHSGTWAAFVLIGDGR